MTLAVMQPYIFPYIGYFQLIQASDVFVFYDDVNFIKQGWINRNRLLVNGKDFTFTISVKNISSFALINETQLSDKRKIEFSKILKTIYQNYKQAPYFDNVYPFIKNLFEHDFETISELAIQSVLDTSNYLGLASTQFKVSSQVYTNQNLKANERIIDICKVENAEKYVNTIAGEAIYSKELFRENNIHLDFLQPKIITYKQFNNEFVPWLSIIDVIMFNSPAEISEILSRYDLV